MEKCNAYTLFLSAADEKKSIIFIHMDIQIMCENEA